MQSRNYADILIKLSALIIHQCKHDWYVARGHFYSLLNKEILKIWLISPQTS